MVSLNPPGPPPQFHCTSPLAESLRSTSDQFKLLCILRSLSPLLLAIPSSPFCETDVFLLAFHFRLTTLLSETPVSHSLVCCPLESFLFPFFFRPEAEPNVRGFSSPRILSLRFCLGGVRCSSHHVHAQRVLRFPFNPSPTLSTRSNLLSGLLIYFYPHLLGNASSSRRPEPLHFTSCV